MKIGGRECGNCYRVTTRSAKFLDGVREYAREDSRICNGAQGIAASRDVECSKQC